MSFKSPSNYNHVCPIFRFGEVLLNAAEAVNEAYGPSDAYQYINELRDRVGMPAYSGMNQEQLRERIRNERRIELCFEDHRFFDERRWKLFENQTPSSEKNLPYYKQVYNLYGVTVTNPEMQCTHTALPEIIPHAHSMYLRITTSRYPMRKLRDCRDWDKIKVGNSVLLQVEVKTIRMKKKLRLNKGKML